MERYVVDCHATIVCLEGYEVIHGSLQQGPKWHKTCGFPISSSSYLVLQGCSTSLGVDVFFIILVVSTVSSFQTFLYFASPIRSSLVVLGSNPNSMQVHPLQSLHHVVLGNS